jgi:hypothetical protein
MRRDAVLATAELIYRLECHCTELRESSRDVMFAVSRLHTDAEEDSLSKVFGEVTFTIDLRSQDATMLSSLNARLNDLAAEIGGRRHIRFEFGGRAMARRSGSPAGRAPTGRPPAIPSVSPCSAPQNGVRPRTSLWRAWPGRPDRHPAVWLRWFGLI